VVQSRARDGRHSGGSVYNFPVLVVAAMRASLMGLLHFVAMRAFGERGSHQVVVRAPVARASFRMSPLWIGHANSSLESRCIARDSMVF